MDKWRVYHDSQGRYLVALFDRIRIHYGKNLISLFVYGSYARGENRLNSDIDLLLVVEAHKIKGKVARHSDFVKNIELPLEDLDAQCSRHKIGTEISVLIFSKDEAKKFNPLYLDMVEDHVKIHDETGFMAEVFEQVKQKMQCWGSRKKNAGGHWYWEIKPGMKWGEVLDYDQ